LSILLSAYSQNPGPHRFDPKLIGRFFSRQPDSDRALGFDMPAASGSSSGRLFSARTVGHLGFTGTSFWMDLDRSIIVILLTNRIHPTRTNEKIKGFRPIIHDMIMNRLVPGGLR
jgi:CubicO group peptidase (beta-lactamase class C family)